MKLFYGFTAICIIASLLTGCSKESSTENSLTDSAAQPRDISPRSETLGVQEGIGDVEAQFWWAIQIHEKSLSPSIAYDEYETKRETISKAEITVTKPYPESIFLQSSSRHRRAFPGHAIRVDLDILLNEESILSYSYITGALSMAEWHVNEVDIMSFVDGTEESVLVRGEARLTMFKDVDETTITLNTPLDGPNVYTTKKLSNTVRVYFK